MWSNGLTGASSGAPVSVLGDCFYFFGFPFGLLVAFWFSLCLLGFPLWFPLLAVPLELRSSYDAIGFF